MKIAYAADCAYWTTVLIQGIIIPIYFLKDIVHFTQQKQMKLFDGKFDKKSEDGALFEVSRYGQHI